MTDKQTHNIGLLKQRLRAIPSEIYNEIADFKPVPLIAPKAPQLKRLSEIFQVSGKLTEYDRNMKYSVISFKHIIHWIAKPSVIYAVHCLVFLCKLPVCALCN